MRDPDAKANFRRLTERDRLARILEDLSEANAKMTNDDEAAP